MEVRGGVTVAPLLIMKFTTDLAGVSWDGLSFQTVDGVIEIPAENIGPFVDLINCGILVPVPEPATDPAPDAPSIKAKAKKA